MIQMLKAFVDAVEEPRRIARLSYDPDSQTYLVAMHNDMGHCFNTRFSADEYDAAEKCARSWVESKK